MKKVKIFESTNAYVLESDVSYFIQNHKVYNVQFQMACVYNSMHYGAMIVYEEM